MVKNFSRTNIDNALKMLFLGIKDLKQIDVASKYFKNKTEIQRLEAIFSKQKNELQEEILIWHSFYTFGVPVDYPNSPTWDMKPLEETRKLLAFGKNRRRMILKQASFSTRVKLKISEKFNLVIPLKY